MAKTVPWRRLVRDASHCFRALRAALAATALAIAGPAGADDLAARLKVLDAFGGTWAVTATTLRPAKAVTTSTTTNRWVLEGRFMQGDSGRKSDGGHDLSMMTYDPTTRAYPLWIFFANGTVFYLVDGRWNEATRTMTWKAPPNTQGSYEHRCTFPDAASFRCQSIAKDWRGAVLFELETTATRRGS